MNSERDLNEAEGIQTFREAGQHSVVAGGPTDAPAMTRQRRARFATAAAGFGVLVLGLGALVVTANRSTEIANAGAEPVASQSSSGDFTASGSSIAAPTVPGEIGQGAATTSDLATANISRQVVPWNTGFLIVDVLQPPDFGPNATMSFSYTEDGKTFTSVGAPLNYSADYSDRWVYYPEISLVKGADGDSLLAAFLALPIDEEDQIQTVASAPLVVYRSADLVNWETSTTDVELPGSWITDSPTAAVIYVHNFLSSISGSGDRWVAVIDSDTSLDAEAMLPAEFQDARRSDPLGTSLLPTEDGVEVDYTDGNGNKVHKTYPWDELDVPAGMDVFIPGAPGFSHQQQFVSGEFGRPGQTTSSPFGLSAYYGTHVVSTAEGFVATSRRDAMVSQDGVVWSPVALPANAATTSTADPVDPYVTQLVVSTSQLNDLQALVLYANEDGGPPSAAYAIRADGELTDLGPLDVGEMPLAALSEVDASSPAMVGSDPSTFPQAVPHPVSFSLQQGQFTIETTMDLADGSLSYTVTETETGTVVAQRSVDGEGSLEPAWLSMLDDVDDSMIVFTDEAGNEVVRVPASEFADAVEQADPNPWGVFGLEETQAMWVAGSADGVRWTVKQFSITLTSAPDVEDDWDTVSTANPAVNGNRMLWVSASGWEILELQP